MWNLREMIFYSEDGSLAQTLGIEKWNTDTIEEFLADKLL
jgi:Sep15/SelM redox domain